MPAACFASAAAPLRLTAFAPARGSLSRSAPTAFLPARHLRVAAPVQLPPRHRADWSCHAGCSSESHDHDHDHEHDHAEEKGGLHVGCCGGSSDTEHLPQNRVTALLSSLAARRLSLRIGFVSLGLLVFAAACQVLLPASLALSARMVATRVPLLAILTLAGLPVLADVSLQIARSPAAALNVDFLMLLAIIVSAFTGALFEAALLATLFALSLSAEDAVSRRARNQLDALTKLAPPVALRLSDADDGTKSDNSSPTEIPLDDVAPGMRLLVRVGQPAPADGVVEKAAVSVSLAHLTGEAIPASKAVGDDVPAGAIPQDTPLVLRVTRPATESFLARITRLVTDAKATRPPVTRFFDRFGAIYARVVLCAALAVATLLPVASRLTSLLPVPAAAAVKPVDVVGRSGSLARGLGVLVTGAPCALLIGPPVAYIAALSAAARRGVLIKGGARAIAATAASRHAVFDKTGTLTTGRLRLVSTVAIPAVARRRKRVRAVAGRGPDDEDGSVLLAALPEASPSQMRHVIAVAAALEQGAVHPVAVAVRQAADSLGVRAGNADETTIVPGQGITGVVDSTDDNGSLLLTKARIGRPGFILSEENDLLRQIERDASRSGETISVLEVGGDVFVLRMRDELRDEARDVVENLKGLGMQISVLTGDAGGAANYIGDSIGSGVHVLADATPAEKLAYVEHLRGDGAKAKKNGAYSSSNGNGNGNGKASANGNGNGVVSGKTRGGGGALMVGDGVNDAAALAASQVGIACGLSTATAVDAADVVLVREDLRNVEWFVRKARATERVVLQNTVIALGLMVGSVFACACGAVPLWLAVTLHEGGTVLVGLNGLRLLSDS